MHLRHAVLVCVWIAVCASSPLAQVILAPPVQIPFNNPGRQIVAVDMEGDGDQDLVIRRNTEIGVLYNLGGSFSLPTTYWSGPVRTVAMAVGDLNGDGLPDVVVSTDVITGGVDSSLEVLLNDGVGGLLAPVSYVFPNTTNERGVHIALGDLNGDGALDLSVGTGDHDLVRIYLNTGSGVLVPGQTFLAQDCNSTAVGDIDSDGNNDLLVAREGFGCVAFINTGFGTFLPGAMISIAAPAGADGPDIVVLEDLNADGILDAAGGRLDSSGDVIGVALGTGSGNFAPAVSHPANYGGSQLAAKDMNGDGLPELFTSWRNSVTAVLENTGGNTFTLLPYLATGVGNGGYAFMDIDSDGDLDAFTTCFACSEVSMIINRSASGGPMLSYPGTGEDLSLLTGVGGALSGGPGSDVKSATANDFLVVQASSPAGSFDFEPHLMVASIFPTGSPPSSPVGLPSIHINTANFFFVVGSPLGPFTGLLSPAGSGATLLVPPGLSSQSAIFQSVVFSVNAANGGFATSDAHEIQIQ